MKKTRNNNSKSHSEKEESIENGNSDEDNKSKNENKLFEIKIPKLILRNLSFKINQDILKKEMLKYGSVVDAFIPKNIDGKYRGYGFVKFSTMDEANKAMNDLNKRKEPFYGTNVAVDWCLPKNVFQKNKDEPHSNGNESKPGKRKAKKDDDDDDEENESGDEDDDDDESGSEKSKNDDDDKDEDEDDDESEEDEEQKKKKKIVNEKFKKKAKEGTKDVIEKRTIFIRNISFNATENDLKELFSKFGEIKYCKLCMDRDFERPKGTAFIQFIEAKSALDACAESNIIEHDSRKLQIDLAISRQQVTDIVSEKKTSTPSDNRNLSLAKEGVVYPNSYEAKGLTKADLDKRAKLEAANTAKLKLLHYFVSTTRLSVHNIPIKCSDQELKTIFLNSLNDNQHDENVNKKNLHKIVECRIMRDLTRVNSDGVAKSKGYGFVEFKKFEDALKALRATNNNPNLFSDKKTRLIVQFSIEDRRALQKKAKRFEKQQNSNKNVKLKLIKSKLTKKQKKKKGVDEDVVNGNGEEDVDKKREKNLIRMNLIEKKLNKRKLDNKNDDNSQNKKAKIANEVVNGNSKGQEVDDEKRKSIDSERKRRLNQKKRLRAKNKLAKSQTAGDSVDRLVDKYLDEKNKKSAKKRWYE